MNRRRKRAALRDICAALIVSAVIVAASFAVIYGAIVDRFGIAPPAGFYAQGGRVVCVEEGRGVNMGDAVTVRTGGGLRYEFYGDDYTTGDAVALLMHDNGTPDDFTDDIIVDARFCAI